jgi:hypothetical protein
MTDGSVVFTDQSLAFGTTDLSVQMSKMKDAGVDFVPCMDTNGVITLAKEMKKQGLDAVQSLPSGYDHQLLSEYGDLFEGSYVRTDFTQFELEDKPQGLRTTSPPWKVGQGAHRELDRGWLNANLFVEGSRRRSELQPAEPDRRHQQDDRLQRRRDAQRRRDDGAHPGAVRHEFCQFYSKIEDSQFTMSFSEPGKPFVCAVVNGDTIDTDHQ